ncbi:hypothetical protein SAMN04488124_1368 [Halogeometricum limi]|uniref:Uncharacterized protein n=1 Tax=Halogeometricum limi TaxID=555875 RepID=A0A1I6GPQ7_9EURY|nr:hypothetical protein SAMN04488124_1368 [Halogeometricum limi]
MSSDGERVVVDIGEQSCVLSRAEAAALQDALGTAITTKREFLRTAGEHRPDGSYVVSRRSSESSGNTKVFATFGALHRLFDRLPEEFTADDVGRTGITGSRRHMVVRHLGEHPEFDCDIASRNPLTAVKAEGLDPSKGDTVDADAD